MPIFVLISNTRLLYSISNTFPNYGSFVYQYGGHRRKIVTMFHGQPPARVTFENRQYVNVTQATRHQTLFVWDGWGLSTWRGIYQDNCDKKKTLDITFILALERGIWANRSDVRSLLWFVPNARTHRIIIL